MPLHQALTRSKIRTILPRHEQGGSFAAEGYARACGKAGVCMATSGPGATNLVTPLADAHMDSVPIVAITGRPDSTLGRAAAVVLDGSVEEEACPLDLAPTTSTTVALALGDALAMAVLAEKGLSRDDFAALHPGGRPVPGSARATGRPAKRSRPRTVRSSISSPNATVSTRPIAVSGRTASKSTIAHGRCRRRSSRSR